MEVDDILSEASVLLADNRQKQYGDYEENWERIGAIWGALLKTEPIPASTVGLMMAGLKLARAVNSPTHVDNYVDCVAYIAGACEITTE